MLGGNFFFQEKQDKNWYNTSMSWYRNTINFLAKYWWAITYMIVILLAVGIATAFQALPTFPDPDSFYHAKISMMIPQEGVLQSFPWLQASVLNDSYIDQHFLYHVFLTPFVYLFDPLVGAKFANVILTTALIVLFYWMLRRYQVKFAFLYTFILMVTMPFMFRINLIKAPAVSIIFLLIGIHLIFQYRYRLLFVLSFFYVWAYGGFILIVIFAGLYALVSIVYDWLRGLSHRPFSVIVAHSRELKLFFISIAGVISGLIINPHFPNNLIFYWNQLVKIGVVNYQSIISVGNEWYPYKFVDLAAGTALVTIVLLIALYLFIAHHKRISKKSITLFLIFIFFFAFTLKSRRYVEYYVPFVLLFEAFAINQLAGAYSWRTVWGVVKRFYSNNRIVATILGVYFIVTLPALIGKDIHSTYSDFQNGIPLDRFQATAEWLQEESEPGDIVFHSSWDEFPILFYYNSDNYYIAGLDPTFTYEYDKTLYHKMVDITIGTQTDNLYEDIHGVFGASYVLVEISHEAMEKNIEQDGGFLEVSRDTDAIIYKVL